MIFIIIKIIKIYSCVIHGLLITVVTKLSTKSKFKMTDYQRTPL